MKLSELDPETVAEEVCRTVVEHLHSVTIAAFPSLELRLEGLPNDFGARGSDLGLTVQTLVRVAQHGLPQWDWTHYGMVADGMLTVFGTAYSSAYGEGFLGTSGPLELPPDVAPDDALGIVLVACHARMLLARRDEGGHGAPVEPKHLAVLAGITADAVQLLIRSGDLAASGQRPKKIKASDARRWLGARGIAGFR